MSIDTDVYGKMRECYARLKGFQDWAQFVAQKSDGIATGFRIIDFYRINGVDQHLCKMEKIREVTWNPAGWNE